MHKLCSCVVNNAVQDTQRGVVAEAGTTSTMQQGAQCPYGQATRLATVSRRARMGLPRSNTMDFNICVRDVSRSVLCDAYDASGLTLYQLRWQLMSSNERNSCCSLCTGFACLLND